MSRLALRIGLATTVLAFGVGCTVPVFAQGTTSGPAANGNVAPGAAMDKGNANAPRDSSGQSTGAQLQQGATSAGAPGVASKPGSEAGPAPAEKTR